MKAPKTWWIKPILTYEPDPNPHPDAWLHVVEKSEYDALLAQAEKLAKQLDHQRSEWLCEVLEREECAGTSHGTYLMENVYSAEKSLAAWQQFKEQKLTPYEAELLEHVTFLKKSNAALVKALNEILWQDKERAEITAIAREALSKHGGKNGE